MKKKHHHIVPSDSGDGASDELVELKRLLLQPEHDLLNDAQHRIAELESRESDVTVDHLSNLLPEAVINRSRKDQQLANALAPTVEKTLQVSVRRNPQPVVDAIFPVIGPAIRKSISEALSSTLESINQSMEHRFSLNALRWRMEARRSGTTFSEIVLRNTLLYRIEQLFIIDRESGVPLLHTAVDSADTSDTSMVSGMLTAIQDFVDDSFGAEPGGALETLEVGDVNVWFESGPRATVAAVIRGIPPRALREHLQEIIETFHLNHARDLESFDGEVEPFEPFRPMLEAGLIEQRRESRSKSSWLLWLVVVVIAVLVGWAIFSAVQRGAATDRLVNALNAEEGIVVTDASRKAGFLHINGLRDPLSSDVRGFAEEAGVDPQRVIYSWEDYHTLSPAILIKRAREILAPPESVALTAREGIVFASGIASTDWIDSARTRAQYFTGSVQYDDFAVVSREAIAMVDAAEEIEQLWIGFPFGSALIPAGEIDRIERIVNQIARLAEAADIRNVPFTITLSGGVSGDATAAGNQRLMQVRAEMVKDILVARGVDRGWLNTAIKEARESADQTPEAQARARSVELKVSLGTDQ